MEIKNVNRLYDNLVQDGKSDIQLLKLTSSSPGMILAELKPFSRLSAHYHREGLEIYQIIAGIGTMELGHIQDDRVVWTESISVSDGDVFEVPPFVVHRLSNESSHSLRIIFFAPFEHLGNDRFFIKE